LTIIVRNKNGRIINMFIHTELLQPLSIQSFILFIHAELSPFYSFRVVSPLSMKSCLPFIHTQLLHSWSIRSCNLLYIWISPALYSYKVVPGFIHTELSPVIYMNLVPLYPYRVVSPLSIQSCLTLYPYRVVSPLIYTKLSSLDVQVFREFSLVF
jgi:hypothetical protein